MYFLFKIFCISLPLHQLTPASAYPYPSRTREPKITPVTPASTQKNKKGTFSQRKFTLRVDIYNYSCIMRIRKGSDDMKTVVGYVRVSTNGQAQEDKYGIE